MNIEIYDRDLYDSDIEGQNVQRQLTTLLANKDGLCMYREPELKTEGDELPTFTIVSQEFGLIFIKAYEFQDSDITEAKEKYWVINNRKLQSEFIRFRNYSHKIITKLNDPILDRNDIIPVRNVYYFPNITNQNLFNECNIDGNSETILINCNLPEELFEPANTKINDNDYSILISVIQNASIINKMTNIYVDEPATNVFEAIELNNKKISRFDFDQMRASLTITNKSERIRGLAGSGKTVLLAMKAAKLHKRFPKQKIAFVFYTKSLYNQAHNLIRKYYNQIADDEPNWENLKVLHSWGGATTGQGFYSYICKEVGFRPKTLREGSLESHCKELLDSVFDDDIFDYILIDEAQDFPPSFFLLASKVAKQPKKIVIAYDELQTTSNIKIPSFTELFGEDSSGKPNIELDPNYDYILKKSYRNSLNVLVTAVAFGFGFYHDITQMIQDNATWDAFGFESTGDFKANNKITVFRPKENSPNSIHDIYPEKEPVSFITSDDPDQMTTQVSNEIKDLIIKNGIDCNDIMVIDIRMNRTNLLNSIQYKLSELGIDSHIPGVVSDARDFFKDNHVTLSTPRNAKGNEVPIVFIVGCENIYEKTSITDLRILRNFMFISITRSKGWVYLYAAGDKVADFKKEVNSINQNIPNIVFSFPNDEKMAEIKMINFLHDNPKAEQINNDMNKIKKMIDEGEGELLKQLLNLNPDLKSSLKDILGE